MPLSRPLAFSCAAIVLVHAGGLAAQSYRINEDLARRALGEVGDFRVSSDGSRAVFSARREGRTQLYGVLTHGSAAPVLLDANGFGEALTAVELPGDGQRVVYLAAGNKVRLFSVGFDGDGDDRIPLHGFLAGSGVVAFRTSTDGLRVAYAATQDSASEVELYVVPIDGSAPAVKLSGPMASGGDVAEFAFSPDGAFVVYRSDQHVNEQFGLYAVRADGSAPAVRLDAGRPLADVQPDFRIGFDSRGVVYRADTDADEVVELYGVPIDGSFPAVKRSAPLVAGGDVRAFDLSPTDDRLVFLADQDVPQLVELWSTRAIAGGVPVKLNAPLSANEDVRSARLSRDGAYVAYGAYDLYGVPADGSAPAVRLNAPFASGRALGRFEIAPDDAHVLWLDDPRGTAQLYGAPLDGSAPAVRLNGDLPPAGRVDAFHLGVADGTVLYVADECGLEHFELFAAPVDGSGPRWRVSGELVLGGAVSTDRPARSGTRIVYEARQDLADAEELYTVPLAGGMPRTLSGTTPTQPLVTAVSLIALGADGERCLYGAREDSSAAFQLHVASVDGSGAPRAMVAGLCGSDASWSEPTLTPDGEHVLYVARTSTGDALYVATSDSAAAVPIVEVPVIYEVLPTPDSTHVVYAFSDGLTGPDLACVPLDGSRAPVALSTRPFSSTAVELAPDSEHAFLLGPAPFQHELYRVPLDGGPSVRMNGDLVAFGNVENFALSPDGARILYRADQEVNNLFDLWCGPSDASAVPLRLSASTANGGIQTADFRFTPDGTRVLYHDRVAGRAHLFSVPSDGSAPPVRLSASVAFADVLDFAVAPDSSRAVYLADAATDGVNELWSVPVAGGAPPMRLNGALVAGGSVYPFEDDPFPTGLGRVVYRADEERDGFYELFSAPLDGSALPVRLHAPLLTWQDFFGIELTPDGSTVVLHADFVRDERPELFAAPIDGSSAPRRVSGPFGTDGRVTDFAVSPDGLRVLYKADQDTAGIFELYAAWLERPRRGASAPVRTIVR